MMRIIGIADGPLSLYGAEHGEGMSMSNRLKKLLYILMFPAGLAAALMIVLLMERSYTAGRSENAPYSDSLLRYEGWNVLREDGTLAEVTPPAFLGDVSGTVTLVNTLPRALESGTCLAFESIGTYAVVRVDGEEIYRNIDGSGGQTFFMWNYVMPDPVLSEGRVTVELSGPDPYDVGIIPVFRLGPRSEILLLAENEIRTDSQICVSILFFGIFVMLCALITFSDGLFSPNFIILGLFIGMLGLSQWLQIVRPAGDVGTWFSTQSTGKSIFGLLPPFYCLYRAHTPSASRKLYEYGYWAGIVFFFLVFLLRWFGAPELWPYVRVTAYAAFEAIYGTCLYCTVFREEDSGKSRVLVAVALAALMLGIGAEYFTHIGYTLLRAVRPVVMGALAFSLLQAAAVLLAVYAHAERQTEMARELGESRIRLMMNQLKPHFIRNSMATIRVITRHDPQKAYDLLYDFANYISYNIDSIRETDLTPFSEELKHIREYTNIEEEHMRHRLRMVYEPGPTDFLIPPLSVEPFVENAIKHGVWPKREGGTVCVGSGETDKAYTVTITDDGVGFDPGNPPPPVPHGHGIGMKYAIERIRTMVNGDVNIESEPGKGTTVTITIPKTEDDT